jgi:DNA-binding MarR family transcriptional regulator
MNNETLTLNELLVKTFKDILKIEEKVLNKNAYTRELSMNEIHVIEIIGLGKQQIMSDISKKLKITIGSLSITINRLVRKGYIEKIKHDIDKRAINIALTEKGILAYKVHENFHKEMIAEGYLEKSSVHETLSMYKVDELKQILDSLGEKKSGKKEELIERILQTSPGENLAALERQHNCYSLSEKGRLFLDSHDDYVTLHLYHSHWNITVDEYENFKSKMQFQGKFNDVVWGIFNKRVLEHLNAGQFGSARCVYYNMTELLRMEEKFQAELETLLLVQFYDLCGTDALQSLSLYKQGIYTKKELSEFYFGIAFAPAIVSRIIQLQEYYHPDMVDRLYQNNRCPIMLCSKQEFLQILNEMFTSTMFDTEKYEKQLRRNFLKMIK